MVALIIYLGFISHAEEFKFESGFTEHFSKAMLQKTSSELMIKKDPL